MVKSGDKIGFKRTMYGVQEFGTYVGEEESEKKTTKWGNTLHVVLLENGEYAKFNYDGVNGSDAMCNMQHHIGWLTTTKEFIHCDRGYECAAWFENILVKKGERFPLFAEVDTYYSDKFNRYFEGGIRRIWTILSGTITNDDFGSRYCGVPLGGYDGKKNAGKSSTHHESWYGFMFGNLVLAARGTPNYSNEHYEFYYDVELFDNIEILPSFVKCGEEDKKYHEKDSLYTTDVSLKRITSKSAVEGIRKMLEEQKLYLDVSVAGDEVHILVEDGDWKHEHLRIKNLVRDYFFVNGFNVELTINQIGESDSDSYSAVHVYSEVK